MSITKIVPLDKTIFLNEKIFRKIQIIFDIANWLWKSEIDNFWLHDLEWVLIYQLFFLWKSAIFDSIKLPFDVQAAEKILHVIYYLCTMQTAEAQKSSHYTNQGHRKVWNSGGVDLVMGWV